MVLDGPPGAVLEPAVRQRRRLVDAAAGFTEDQWAHPSRCAGWTSRDVLVHLDSTNAFWSFAIGQGVAGEPTQFLVTFDPVRSPAELVAGAAALSSAEVLDRFRASTDALCDLLSSLEPADWEALAESPPGHVSVDAVVHHALWDAWIHERDILLPMDVDSDVEADEVEACLRYAAALSPTFALNRGSSERGTLAVEADDPDVAFVVEVGDHVAVRSGGADEDPTVRLTGPAIDLLEALSVRRPLEQPVPAEAAWMLDGLTEVFDTQRLAR